MDSHLTSPEAGTSLAAPLWAGFMALVNQQAAANGQPPIGFVNPALYAIGKSTNYHSCFHDITTGSNTNSSSPTKYQAVAGYDLCTGWGHHQHESDPRASGAAFGNSAHHVSTRLHFVGPKWRAIQRHDPDLHPHEHRLDAFDLEPGQ